MARPVTMFTGQWADLPLAELVRKCERVRLRWPGIGLLGRPFRGRHRPWHQDGYCSKKRELLEANGLQVFAISNHLAGQAVLDHIDARHKAILPPHVWGDGDPAEVNARAAEEMKDTARAAQKLGVGIVNGFTGSSIWQLLYSFPPVPAGDDRRRLQAVGRAIQPDPRRVRRVRREVRPGGPSRPKSPSTCTRPSGPWRRSNYREEFGFNFDPSHLIWQGVDPVEFIREFPDRIFHVHMKDAIVTAQRPHRHPGAAT